MRISQQKDSNMQLMHKPKAPPCFQMATAAGINGREATAHLSSIIFRLVIQLSLPATIGKISFVLVAMMKCKINFTTHASEINFGKQTKAELVPEPSSAFLPIQSHWNMSLWPGTAPSDGLIKLNINLLLSWWYRTVIKAHPPEISFRSSLSVSLASTFLVFIFGGLLI